MPTAARRAGWRRRGLDRQGTRGLWKKANRELETTVEGERPLARVHALLALPEKLAPEQRRVLVVFDEFQDLLTAGEDLDGLVRSHVQHHAGVASYCYAGSQASLLRALFEDRNRPLFGQARDVLEGEGHIRRAGRDVDIVDPFLSRWLQERI